MKIRALANGNVIEAHEDAAKELIAAGIYEAYDETENNSTQPPVEKKPTKKRGAR